MRASLALRRCSELPLPPFDPPRRLKTMLEKNPQGFDEFGPRYWTGIGSFFLFFFFSFQSSDLSPVVHTKNEKTAAVLVERRDPHPIYKKLVLNSRKFMVHDPESMCISGDKILFEKSRPFSKQKHWVFRALLSRDAASEYLRCAIVYVFCLLLF